MQLKKENVKIKQKRGFVLFVFNLNWFITDFREKYETKYWLMNTWPDLNGLLMKYIPLEERKNKTNKSHFAIGALDATQLVRYRGVLRHFKQRPTLFLAFSEISLSSGLLEWSQSCCSSKHFYPLIFVCTIHTALCSSFKVWLIGQDTSPLLLQKWTTRTFQTISYWMSLLQSTI